MIPSVETDGFLVAQFEVKQRRQRKRIFQRLVSGIYFNRRVRLRFLTLTSAPGSPDIAISFKHFIQQVRREYKNNRFEYFAVFTDEGYGVIHCIFVGQYIPFKWIQDKWKKYHGAYQVNIKEVKDVYNAGGLAGYFISQYIGRQNAIRWASHSRNWVYPGYHRDWHQIKKLNPRVGMSELIYIWHKHLDEKYSYQKSLL